jgi:hypothetical protein
MSKFIVTLYSGTGRKVKKIMLYVLTLKFAPPLLVSHHNQNGYLLSLSLSFPSVAGKDFAYTS